MSSDPNCYLENTSNSDPIIRHKPLPPKALGYSPLSGESKREVSPIFIIPLPQPRWGGRLPRKYV